MSENTPNRNSKSSNSESSGLANYLKSIDHFAVTFNFRVDKKPKYGSVTGGISFILFALIAIAYTLKRFFDYISWTDSKIQFIEKSINPSPALNFKNLTFSYSVKITFENDTLVKNSLYADLFQVEQYFVYKNSTYTNKAKNLPRKCNNNDFYNKSADYPIFQKDSIENFDCFDVYDNYTLQGIYTDSYITYIEIILKINSKYFSNYSELRKIFENDSFKFTLYYTDTYNDVTNFSDPVFYKVDAIYTYLDLNYYKRNNVYFQQFNYASDKNLFYNNYISSTYMKLFTNQEIMSPILDRENYAQEEKTYLNKFFLRAVNNEKTVKLSFIKIPEFLASLSGLLVNLLVILKIMLTALNFFEAKQTIMTKIMKYKDVINKTDKTSLDYLEKKFEKNLEKNSKKNEEKMLTNDIKATNQIYGANVTFINKSQVDNRESIYPSLEKETPNYNYYENNNNKENILKVDAVETEFLDRSRANSNNSNTSKIDDNQGNNLRERLNESMLSDISNIREIKVNKNPYLLKMTDFCKLIFCCKCKSKSYTKKINIFNNAQTKFNYNLDLVTYMKKMQEIEILKYLILDKDTIHLMNFISKPSVCLSNSTIKDEEYQLFFENIKKTNSFDNQNIDNIKKSFDKLMKKPNLNDVEKRILKLFNLQIHEILN